MLRRKILRADAFTKQRKERRRHLLVCWLLIAPGQRTSFMVWAAILHVIIRSSWVQPGQTCQCQRCQQWRFVPCADMATSALNKLRLQAAGRAECLGCLS